MVDTISLSESLPAKPPLGSTLRRQEICASGLRFDAASFGLETRQAQDNLRASGLPLQPLYGPREGLCHEATNGFRFRRIFVEEEYGTPFLSSSDIINLWPIAEKHVSVKLTRRIDDFLVKRNDVLISRSGTIGNVALASEDLEGAAVTEDVIRLRAESPQDAGFAAAFLRTHYGRAQVVGAAFGSVVKHVESSHLRRVLLPRPSAIPARENISALMIQAAASRARANRLLAAAQDRTLHLLGLPPVRELRGKGLSGTVYRRDLSDRFEGSFHDDLSREAERLVWSLPSVEPLETPSVASVRAITRFRKRVYVERGGIPLLSSKQIFQVDPIDIKRIARGAHAKDLPEIALHEDMLLVTCSGTIGKVQIVPSYMDGWTANQHANRVEAGTDVDAGYLYAWLSSAYGGILLRRLAYGSVILELDRDMLRSVPVPLLDPGRQAKVGELVRQANALRSEAWHAERTAIRALLRAIGS